MTQGDASIAELAHQMGQFPGICRGGILYHGMNMEDNNVYEQLRAQKDTIVRNRNTSWRPELERLRRLPGPGLYEAQANLKGRRGAAFEALNDLIAAVADTKKSYDALRSDVKIRKALRGFAPLQLSPSPEFNSTIRELGEFQKWVGQRPTFTAQ
jgi:hypothetical protein